MRSPPKKNKPLLGLSEYLLSLGRRLGNWIEGDGLGPRLFQIYLREK